MNCQNCGAPMRLILEKRQYVCNHCTSTYFPEPNSEGVRILGEKSLGQCPVCRVPHLVFANVANKTVLHCQQCRGMLMQICELFPVIQVLRSQRPARSEVIPPPINPLELQRRISCPVCRRTMETYLYGDGGNVYVDSCIDCGVIWLDYFELKRIVDAPTRPKRESYVSCWEQAGVQRYNDDIDFWGRSSVLTADVGEFLARLF